MGDYRNFSKALIHSFGFLLIFVAFNSSQNLQAKLMKELGYGSLGFFNLASLYLSLVIGAFLSTTIVARYGTRTSHCFGVLGILLWILVSIIPAVKEELNDNDLFVFQDYFIYTVMIVASCVCGFTSGILWTAQGCYTSECSTESTKGFYFSLFWTMYMVSQIVGNTIAAFVLGFLNEVYYFIIMAVISSTSLPIFMTLQKPENVQQIKQQVRRPSQQMQTHSFNPNNYLQPTNRASSIDSSQSNHEYTSTFFMIKSVVLCMFSKKMLLLLPQCAWAGVSLAFISGMLVLIMSSTLEVIDQDNSEVYKQAMIAMIFFGFGEVCGSPFIGRIIDKYSSRQACIVNLVLVIITVGITLLYINVFEFGILAYTMTFLWGFQDGCVNTHCLSILGFEFYSKTDPFAVYNILQCFFVFGFQIIQSQIEGQIGFMVYTGAVGIIGMLSVSTTYFFHFRKKQSFIDGLNNTYSTSINSNSDKLVSINNNSNKYEEMEDDQHGGDNNNHY